MKTAGVKQLLAALLLLGLPVVHLPAAADLGNGKPPGAAGGVPSHAVTEKDERGIDHPVTNRTSKVDANSDILVHFLNLTNAEAARTSPEWLKVHSTLNMIESLATARAALQARLKIINLKNTNEVAALRRDNSSFNAQSRLALDRLQAEFGMTDEEFQRIKFGEFDGQVNELAVYPNLARWARKKMEALNREAVALVSNRTVFVTVQAFHQPVGGQLRAVHVDNYDSIPAGEYQPIDRLGLRMTPQEQAQLASDIKNAEKAKEVLKNLGQVAGNSASLRSNLLARVQSLIDRIDSFEEPSAWKLRFDDAAFFAGLNRLINDPALTDIQRAAAASNVIWLTEFKSEFTTVGDTVRSLLRAKTVLMSGQAGSLSEMLSQTGAVFTALNGINSLITNRNTMITNWPVRAKNIVDKFAELQGQLAAEQRAALWPEEVQKYIASLKEAFPEIVQIIGPLREFFGDSGIGQAAATLAEADLPAIWRDDLTPGLLELPRVGLVQDDTVLLKLKYRERGPDGKPGASLPDETYKMKAVLMGLHRKFGASVIYARGLGGTDEERQWKPNVAATVHWFYRSRQEDNAWKRGWNYVNPGFGVHLASLDQGSESVEFGAGLNVSLFDNLLNGGIGLNLNNDERPYVFFGLSLLEALNKAKSAGSSK